MAAGKAGARVTQHRCNLSDRYAGLQEFARNPFVGDAPVGGWVALQDAQASQTTLI